MPIMKNTVIFSAFLSLFLSTFTISYANANLFGKKESDIQLNIKPSWLNIEGSFFYDGETDDLVTSGHGFSQLSQSRIVNKFTDEKNPTFTELKKERLNRYIDSKTGEGEFFGFKKQSLTALFDGRIAGTEIQASLKNGDEKVAFLLQIPLDFDKNQPCIVAIPARDSDGLYNAKDVQIGGLWGLNHNCAVVYNDKGLGNALFDLANDNGYLINGKVANRKDANDELLFVPDSTITNQQKYANRYALKQLHSKQNPEEHWGQYVLDSIEFAFYQINETFSPSREAIFNKDNTKVLVYGYSDGAGAALKAGELDKNGIIDGIIAVNPQIQIANDNQISLEIKRGDSPVEPLKVKSLIDYTSYGALYMPCAIFALKEPQVGQRIPDTDNFYFAKNRCTALKEVGLLSADKPLEQANEALDKLYQYGWTPEMVNQLPYHYYTQSINLPYRYISQYGRYGVDDHLCDYSVASIDTSELFNNGAVEPLEGTNFALLWAQNSGSLPIKDSSNRILIDLVNDVDPQGARREFYSRSANSQLVDYNLSGAMCLRDKISERRVNEGLSRVLASGKLNRIKTIIVHGQLNTTNLPDYSSRAYAALNSYVEGSFSGLKYIEVENASDISSEYPFDNTLVPIEYYGESAANWLWNNLTKNTSLPDSQVVRAKPRGGEIGLAPSINSNNIVPILQTTSENNRIKLIDGTIQLPSQLPNNH